jgi:hypothetical protein
VISVPKRKYLAYIVTSRPSRSERCNSKRTFFLPVKLIAAPRAMRFASVPELQNRTVSMLLLKRSTTIRDNSASHSFFPPKFHPLARASTDGLLYWFTAVTVNACGIFAKKVDIGVAIDCTEDGRLALGEGQWKRFCVDHGARIRARPRRRVRIVR